MLHIAADKGQTDIVEILTSFTSECEIDLTLKDKVGGTWYMVLRSVTTLYLLDFLTQEGKSALQRAEEKQHGDIAKLLTELMRTDSEMDITQKGEEERDSEVHKETGMQSVKQLEVGPSDEQETSGVWKRLKQRLQRNTQDIKLVSGTKFATRYSHTFTQNCFHSM